MKIAYGHGKIVRRLQRRKSPKPETATGMAIFNALSDYTSVDAVYAVNAAHVWLMCGLADPSDELRLLALRARVCIRRVIAGGNRLREQALTFFVDRECAAPRWIALLSRFLPQ
jgi:hypothetical protein